jgi:uncharacterized protein YjeT (DUF2065 family)
VLPSTDLGMSFKREGQLLSQSRSSLISFLLVLDLCDLASRQTQATPTTCRYSEIGQALHGDPIITNLLKDICETRDAATPSHHFYLVDGPSGIGKTQLPFAFQAAGVPLCHLLMTIDSKRSQDIYRPLEFSSNVFTNALSHDVKHYFGDTDCLDVGFLSTNLQELETVGVIFALLNAEFVDNKKWTVPQLAGYVRDFQDKRQLPIFFLDEVLPHDNPHGGPRPVSSALRLARNLLRAVGLVAVLMGTNSCAANFISAATNSRCEPRLWCKLITRLPPPNDQSLRRLGAERVMRTLNDRPHLVSICPFLTQQFRSCTPWFIELFVKVVEQNDDWLNPSTSAVEFMDKVVCLMAKIVYSRKNISSQSFLRAQFCYHLEPFRKAPSLSGESKTDCRESADERHEQYLGEGEQEDTNRTPEEEKVSGKDRTGTPAFVASHFASLDDESCDLFLTANGLGKDEMTQWSPTASFQRAGDDSFLYLMLGDGNQGLDFPAPFLLSLPLSEGMISRSPKRMTTRETFLNLTNYHQVASSMTTIPTENHLAVKRNGADLEVTAAVAVEIASHRGGLGGIEIANFLLQLATELLPSYQLLEWRDSSNITNLFSGKKVPYLSSEGDSWPATFKAIEGVCWGDLHRTEDKERIDLKILTAGGVEISVECKNSQNNLDVEVVCAILQRIPQSSCLHLVICTHLQSEYFTAASKTPWKEFKAQNGLEATAILRVVMEQGSKLSLAPLFSGSVPEARSHKLVIFFPFEDWDRKKRKYGGGG